jgi:hypothetical protein
MEKSVGIEQDQVPARRGLEGQIVGRSKAEIYFAPRQFDWTRGIGKLARHHLRCAIAGTVVDHENLSGYFSRQASAFFEERLEAFPQQITYIQDDDDDR